MMPNQRKEDRENAMNKAAPPGVSFMMCYFSSWFPVIIKVPP